MATPINNVGYGVHPIKNPAAMAVVTHVKTQANLLRHQEVDAADVVAIPDAVHGPSWRIIPILRISTAPDPNS